MGYDSTHKFCRRPKKIPLRPSCANHGEIWKRRASQRVTSEAPYACALLRPHEARLSRSS